MANTSMGEIISTLRKEKGMTQKDIAGKLPKGHMLLKNSRPDSLEFFRVYGLRKRYFCCFCV